MIDLAKFIRPKSAPSVDPIIKDHIQDTVNRQKFIIKMCRALMLYGAPTHRIEEYMKATARVLETEAQFLYIPGCMIVSFDDSHTHTTEVKLVRVDQTVDLGRLRDTVSCMTTCMSCTRACQHCCQASRAYITWEGVHHL